MKTIEDLIKLLVESKYTVKSFTFECTAPNVLRGFNIEYFEPDNHKPTDQMICG